MNFKKISGKKLMKKNNPGMASNKLKKPFKTIKEQNENRKSIRKFSRVKK